MAFVLEDTPTFQTKKAPFINSIHYLPKEKHYPSSHAVHKAIS